MDGFYTQRAFHRVQEHPKWSSDEEVMIDQSWRVDIVQGLRYSVESHAIVYPRMHPAMLQRGFQALACHRMHPATQHCGFHAPACQRAPWPLQYTPVFHPKPSQNSPCPPVTISSQLRPHNMPQTRYQNHSTINSKSPQK